MSTRSTPAHACPGGHPAAAARSRRWTVRRRRRRAPALAAATAALAALAVASAAEPPPLLATHPLAVAGARPAGLELLAPDRERWTLSLTLAYGNSFAVDEDVHRAHLDVDGPGRPLSDDALAVAAARGARYAIDAETVVTALEATGPVGRRLYAGVRLPWWRIGGTAVDPLPRRWHELLGIGDGGRDLYPDGETVVWMPGSDRALSLSDPVSGMGDVAAWLGRTFPAGRLEHRIWLAATAPTGSHPLLDGDGLRLGLRWATAWSGRRWSLSGGLGVTGGSGDTVLGGPRRTTGHGWLAAGLEVGDRLRLDGLVRVDGSPYSDLHGPPADQVTAELAVGATVRLGPRHRLQLALGEDRPVRGFVPDFSVQVRLLSILP